MWVVGCAYTHAKIVDQMPAFGGLNIPFHLGIHKYKEVHKLGGKAL
jgi:hypothetical protein